MRCHFVHSKSLSIGLFAVIAAVGLSGCASSGLVNVWMDPQFAAPPMKSMLVVAMQPDVAKRRLWEDAFANALLEQGVTATPSYQLFPNELPDTNGIIAAVREHSFDGCIATAKLPSATQTQDIPGYISDSLVTGYNPWTNRYYDYFEQIYTPGYTESQTVVRHRIEVWSTRDKGALVWTATSEVLDPVTSEAVYHRNRVVDEIMDDLTKNGVIPKKK